MRFRRGTTLLEILIVAILLMGVMGTVAAFFAYMPRWAETTTGQLTMMRESMAASSMLQGEISRAGDCACPAANEVRITNSSTGDQWVYYLVPDPAGVPGRFELRTSKDGKVNFVRVAGLVKTLTCTTQTQYNGIDLCLVYEEMDGRLRRECAQFRRATTRTKEVRMADFDRDGFKDLVVVRPQQTYVQAYKGSVDGTFTLNVTSALNAASEPRALEAVDFDGNGKLDLAVLTTRDVQILESDPSAVTNPTYNGTPSFSVTQTIALPASTLPQTIAAGDLDNDGAVDLAVTDYAGQCIQILYGLTTNKLRFGTPVRWPTSPTSLAGRPRRLKLARMNTADTHLDLVVGFGSPTVANASVAVALGTGERTIKFAAAVAYASGAESWDLDLGDLNRDGVLDVVSADWTRDRLAMHTGTAAGALNAASFSTTVSPTALQFVDHDGQVPVDVGVVSRVRGITTAFNVYQGLAGGTIGTTLSATTFPSNEVDGITVATDNVSPDRADGWAVGWMTADPGGVKTSLGANEIIPGSMDVKIADLNRDAKTDAVTVIPTPGSFPRHVVQTYQGMAGGTFNVSGTLALNTPLDVPRAVEVGDFSRDGRIDIAVLTTTNIQVLLSTTPYNSRFAFAVTSTIALPADARPYALVSVDLDRDGKLDLIASDAYHKCVYVYYGSGTGTFAADASGARWPAAGTDFPGQPWRMATGDIDRDGDVDLVVGMQNPTTANRCVAVARGTGLRTTKFAFATGSPYTAGAASWDVAVGDLADEAGTTTNRDGILDVVTADWTGGQILVLKGQSSGNLLGTAVATTTPSPVAVRFLAEQRFDAIPDVAVVSRVRGVSADLRVYTGTTGGGLTTPPTATTTFPSTNLDAVSLVAGSVTHDGRDDWVAATITPVPGGIRNGNATSWTTLGSATTMVTGTMALGTDRPIQGLAVVDYNRDGFPDVVGARANSTTMYRWPHDNGTNPSFFGTANTGYAISDDGRESVIGDFNADGWPDLVVTVPAAADDVQYFPGGSGGYSTSSRVDSGVDAEPDAIAAGDFTGDGKLDIVVASSTNDRFRVYQFNSGSFTSSAAYTATGANPMNIVAADLNLDGKLDVVTSNRDGDNITIAMGNGDGTFQTPTNLSETANSEPYFVDVGDVDRDGIPDIVVAHKLKLGSEVSNGSAYVRYGRGFTWTVRSGAIFDGVLQNLVGTNPGLSAVRMVDVDRDGDLDLVAVGYNSNKSVFAISKNDGNGNFGVATRQFIRDACQPWDVVPIDSRRLGLVDFLIPYNVSADPYIVYGN
jgi:hypothetical protein